MPAQVGKRTFCGAVASLRRGHRHQSERARGTPEQWYAPAYRTATLLLGDTAKVDDAVQEAFLRLWRFRDALPKGDGLRPWIYRVVVNACYSSARTETRHAGRRAPQDALDAVVSSDPTPDELADQRDRASLVRQAILSLPRWAPSATSASLLRRTEREGDRDGDPQTPGHREIAAS